MMKKRMKKLIGISLTMVMAASLLGGCGSSGSTDDLKADNESGQAVSQTSGSSEEKTQEAPESTKKFDGVELKLFGDYAEGTATEAQLEAINAILSEKLGVTITEVEAAEDQTYELVLGGDEDIDLVFAANYLRYDDNAKNGLYAEITDEDLQTYAPDIWAYAEEKGNGILETTKNNGVRYAIGSKLPAGHPMWAYRGDIADKYGIGDINNVDDLEKYLFAIAENETEMIAMDVQGSAHYLVASLFYPVIGWTAPGAASYGSAVNVNFFSDDYQVILSPETDEYLELVTRMHEWYEKGVFSKSILSSTTALNDSFKAGRSGVARVSNPDEAQSLYDEFQTDDRKDWDVRFLANYPEVELLKGNHNSMMAISSYSDNVEACLAVYNEIFSNEELYRLFKYGIEGVHYKITDGAYEAVTDDTIGQIKVGISHPEYDFAGKTYTFTGAEELIPQMEAAAYDYPLTSMSVNYDAIYTQKVAVDEVFAQYTRANLLGVFDCTPEEVVAAEIAAYKAAGVDEYIAEIQRQVDEFVAGMQ